MFVWFSTWKMNRHNQKDNNNNTSNGIDNSQKEYNYKETNRFYLVGWDKAPEFMKINPFVTYGYRPCFSFILCIKSMFRLHNEVI